MADDDIDFSELWFIFRKNLLLIIAIFVIGIAGVGYYTFTTTPTFEATSQVLIGDDSESLDLFSSYAQSIDVETQVAIIESASVLGVVEDSLGAAFDIDVSAVGQSNVISITASGPNPLLVEQAANQVAANYVMFVVAGKQASALEVSSFISEQLLLYEGEVLGLTKAIISLGDNLTEEELVEKTGFEQELAVKNALISSLLNRREEAGILARETSAGLQVLQEASIPDEPSSPNIPLNLAVGVILSFIISYGVAYVKESVRDAVFTPELAASLVNSPILGVLPRIVEVDTFKKYIEQHRSRKGVYAEKMRMIRANVDFWRNENEGNIISVTSPQRNDGKTTTATNLALSEAHHGRKVLLVEGNLRNPMLDGIFKRTSKDGLSDVLRGDAKLSSVVMHSSVKGLDVICAGKAFDYPGELMKGKMLRELLLGLKYDLIVIDTPSLDIAESTDVARLADGVVVVIRHDKTVRGNVLKAKDSLSKANVIGVVYNAE